MPGEIIDCFSVPVTEGQKGEGFSTYEERLVARILSSEAGRITLEQARQKVESGITTRPTHILGLPGEGRASNGPGSIPGKKIA